MSPSATQTRAMAIRHAMPVLRQAGVLAQLLGLRQQLSGETEVVVFAVERAHPDVHVGCPAQD